MLETELGGMVAVFFGCTIEDEGRFVSIVELDDIAQYAGLEINKVFGKLVFDKLNEVEKLLAAVVLVIKSV